MTATTLPNKYSIMMPAYPWSPSVFEEPFPCNAHRPKQFFGHLLFFVETSGSYVFQCYSLAEPLFALAIPGLVIIRQPSRFVANGRAFTCHSPSCSSRCVDLRGAINNDAGEHPTYWHGEASEVGKHKGNGNPQLLNQSATIMTNAL